MIKMTSPQRENYLYQACYCEENIWQLCQCAEFANSDVLVIAALGDYFPILWQKAATAPYSPVMWDYHVVLLWHAPNGKHYILDFDTTLPFCTPLAQYIQHAFFDENQLQPQMRPRFRQLPAAAYVATLQSDRRHMQTPDGWLAEPPTWPSISPKTSNLPKFTDMYDTEYGKIFTAEQLLQHHHIAPLIC